MANKNQDWDDLGRSIQDIVDRAVNSRDFQKLNQTVSQAVGKAVDMGSEAVRKAMDDARAVIQDGLTRYVKKKTKARSMAKAESDPFAELEGWESMEQIQDAYGYGEITADRRDKLTDLWEAREAAKNSRKGSDKYTDLVTEMLETAIRRVGGEYADMLFEYDRQRREAEKQCEQLAMEGMMKK